MSSVGERQIGPWHLLEELGRGGNAIVWRAVHAADESEVALKVLKSRKSTAEPYRRFVREIEFLRSLDGFDGVLPILDAYHSEVLQLGALIARTHQERWDGSGFPQGLHGEEIPLEGRILAIADVFECLTSDRVYRAAFSIEDAVDMMREQSGRHFDPDLLDSFFDALPEVQAVYAALAPNCRLASYRPGAACDST